MARSWNPAFRAFTLPEALVTIALLVVSAGLATQLLTSSLVFHQAHDAEQKRIRSLLDLKTGLLSLTARIAPPSWSDPEAFQPTEGGLTLPYWDGAPQQSVRVVVDAESYVRWSGPETELRWGPWKDAQIELWKTEERVLGVRLRLPLHGQEEVLLFPWGSWPL